MSIFPNIASIALQSLRMPCTIVPVERYIACYRRGFVSENLSKYVICHYNAAKGLKIDFSKITPEQLNKESDYAGSESDKSENEEEKYEDESSVEDSKNEIFRLS